MNITIENYYPYKISIYSSRHVFKSVNGALRSENSFIRNLQSIENFMRNNE